MSYIVRDFNSLRSDIGDISIYLYENQTLFITVFNLHDIGQAWMYVKYPLNIDLYNMLLSILNKMTIDIYQTKLEYGKSIGAYPTDIQIDVISIIPKYQDIVIIKEDLKVDNSNYSSYFGNYIPFTRESVGLLDYWSKDNNEEYKDVNHYIIYGEFLENGDLIYDKPIQSNHYNYKDLEEDSESDI